MAGADEPRRLRLGISSCLLGNTVRWDGGHRRDAFLSDVLGRFVEWVPVCPELDLGLGVPREPIRLVGRAEAPRLLSGSGGADHTEGMRRLAGVPVWSARDPKEVVSRYRRGRVPLRVPWTLVRDHARRQGIAYLVEQAYLDPDPAEVALRERIEADQGG